MAILLVGCGVRSGPDAIVHGMKWSIAQRDLEQNGWVNTMDKPARFAIARGGKAYRYMNAKVGTFDITTETLGDIEKVDRIFDLNGKEMTDLKLKDASAP